MAYLAEGIRVVGTYKTGLSLRAPYKQLNFAWSTEEAIKKFELAITSVKKLQKAIV